MEADVQGCTANDVERQIGGQGLEREDISPAPVLACLGPQDVSEHDCFLKDGWNQSREALRAEARVEARSPNTPSVALTGEDIKVLSQRIQELNHIGEFCKDLMVWSALSCHSWVDHCSWVKLSSAQH